MSSAPSAAVLVGRSWCHGLHPRARRAAGPRAERAGRPAGGLSVRASKGFGSSSSSPAKQKNSPKQPVQQKSSLEGLPLQVAAGLQGTNIYLVGMMGSGKSSAGKKLAEALEYVYFDSDALLESATGTTVAEVFAEVGADEFRKLETQVLKELHCYTNCVISTGGGAVLAAQNWSYMQQGIVVWLRGSSELLANRIEKVGLESRPLLADCKDHDAVVAKLDGILEERLPYYKNSDIEIEMDTGEDEAGLTEDDVVQQILQSLKTRMQEAIDEREEKKNFKIENTDEAKQQMQQNQPEPSSPFWKRLGELQREE